MPAYHYGGLVPGSAATDLAWILDLLGADILIIVFGSCCSNKRLSTPSLSLDGDGKQSFIAQAVGTALGSLHSFRSAR